MSCSIRTEDYGPVVKDLIKLDSQKYRNYDNVAKFLIDSNLGLEQKKMALYNIAHIFRDLHSLDNELFNPGKLQEIINLSPVYDNSENFVKESAKIYGISFKNPTSLKAVLESIDTLKKDPIFLPYKIEPVLKLIENYFKVNIFGSDEEKKNLVLDLKNQLIQIVKDKNSAQGQDIIEKYFDEKLVTKTKYVPLASIQELTVLNNTLVTLKNNTMVEAMMIDGVYKKEVDTDGDRVLVDIPADQIKSTKNARPSNFSSSNNGNHIFNEDIFNSGFTVDSVEPGGYDALMTELSKADPSQIKIHVVKLSTLGDERVQRIKNLPQQNEEINPSLSNRNHETFENAQQQKLLSSVSNATVLTVSRPKKSEQGFAFIGQIVKADKTIEFNIYAMNNYVFVSSDNTTKRLDTSNAKDLEDLKKLSSKNVNGKIMPLTNNDIIRLVQTQLTYENFRERIIDTVDLQSNDSVDVTDIFREFYQASNVTGKRTQISLSDAVQKNPNAYSTKLQVVTLDEKDEPLKDENGYEIEETINLPFAFSKTYQNGVAQYEPVSFLAANQRIKYTENGQTQLITDTAYIYYIFSEGDVTLKKIKDLFKYEDEAVKEFYEINTRLPKASDGINKTMNFVVSKDRTGKLKSYPTTNAFELQYQEFFVKYIASMMSVLSDPETAVEKLNYNKANFYGIKDFLKKVSFEFEFDNLNNLKLAIRPYNVNSNKDINGIINKDNNSKSNFNFKIDIGRLKSIGQSIDSDSKVVKDVLAEFPVLKDLVDKMKTDPSAAYEFYTKVYDISVVNPGHKSVTNFLNEVVKAQNEFSKLLKENVIDELAKNKSEEVAAFNELMKKDLTFKGDIYKPEALLFETVEIGGKEQLVPKIKSVRTPKDKTLTNESYRTQFNRSLKNISIYQAPKKVFKIVDKSSPGKSPSQEKVTASIPEEVKPAEQVKPATNPVIPASAAPKKTINKRGGGRGQGPLKMISSAEGEYRTATPQDIQSEVDWLRANLPMLGLDVDSLKDIVNLTEIDGAVLGMMLNKMIYLNKALPAKGVVYHEAFHGVFRYLLTDSERKNLVQQVIDNKKNGEKFTPQAVRKFAKERNLAEQDYQKLVELIAEEILADGFQNYMLQEKPAAPKTLLQRFFEMLKKILNFFVKNQNNINNLYANIKTGKYSTAVFKSDMFENQPAYVLIDGLQKYRFDQNKEIEAVNTDLDPENQKQLVNMVVSEMLRDNTLRDFRTKFEVATMKLLENVYNIDYLLNQRPLGFASKKEFPEADKVINNASYQDLLTGEIYVWNGTSYKKIADSLEQRNANILNKYNNLYKQYMFVLGGRMKGFNVYDINQTGDVELDYDINEQIIQLPNGETIENTNGEYSYQVLAELVRDKYEKAKIFDRYMEKPTDTTVDAEEVENIILGESASLIKNEQQELNKEELDSNYDEGFAEEDRSIDSYVRQVRRYLSTVQTTKFDETLGITVSDVVDGDYLFPAMLKMVANDTPKNIIDTLKTRAETLIEDGYLKEGNDLMAVVDKIFEDTKADPTQKFKPTVNNELANLFIDALHGIELNYLFFNVNMKITEEDLESDLDANTGRSTINIRLFDKVIETDASLKRDQLVTNFLKEHSASADNAEFKKAIETLRNFSKFLMVKKPKNENIFVTPFNIFNKELALKQMTDSLYGAMKTIGLNVPKSLIRLSLLGINNKEFLATTEGLSEKTMDFYNDNIKYVNENMFLNSEFFIDLEYILDFAYVDSKGVKTSPESKTAIPNKRYKEFLDAANKTMTDRNVSRFMTILKSASKYVAKYDPTNLPSTIKNAEGKSIYRFAKFNPLIQVGLKANSGNIEEIFKDDPYWNNTLKPFISDNPYLGELLLNPTSNTAKDTKLFLQNFNVAMFGGVQQQLNGVYKDGQTFKSLDNRSLYLLHIYSFMNQTTYTGRDRNTITTYFRPYHQLESTNTNFMITSLYEKFISKDRTTTNDNGYVTYTARNGKKYMKIVKTMEDTIRQEYKRIQREWQRRETLKNNYDNGTKNEIITSYNGRLNIDNKTANTDDSSLRAYKFHKLSDFFGKSDTREELAKDLIQLAKEGYDYDKIKDTFTDELLSELEVFAMEQFDKYLQTLERTGVIKKQEINKDDLEPGQPITTYYTDASEFFPSEIKVDYATKKRLTEIYPDPRGFTRPSETTVRMLAVEPLESMLFDQFMNAWHNGLVFNELMDGDIALNVKNSQDYIKRLKKIVATGSNMKDGFHTTAYINNLRGFTHEKYPTYGPYRTLNEIDADWTIESNVLREELKNGFQKAVNNVKEQVVDGNGNIIPNKFIEWNKMMREVADGQSYSLLMHQMDMHDTLGRLTERAKNILIDKQFRALTKDEVDYLAAQKIVNNAKKTVTAARNIYHKNSEDYIDRTDVSVLNIIPNPGESEIDARVRTYETIRALYNEIYDIRKQINATDNADEKGALKLELQSKVSVLHGFYSPIKHREVLHNLLNSMEFFNIDQVMDPNASKNATLLPIDVYEGTKGSNGYINLELSSVAVPNEAKFLQVETSSVKDVAKNSVQGKVLVPADIDSETFEKIVRIESEQRGTTVTDSELAAMKDLAQELNNYKLSLKKATKARLSYYLKVLRKGNDFDIGKIYTMIRESLQSQNAPASVLNMFTVNPDGTPVINPNDPIARQTVEYYMLAQYSKHVTDEKTAGAKDFHISSWGMDVLADVETNKVVTTETYASNPSLFDNNPTKFKRRSLGVTVEEQPDGSMIYYVECIVPKPFFENEKHKIFWLKNLTKSIGTRVPTEDKRSMVVLKVVDFMDSSKMNNIIVPQFVHLLAGSDFDIDSLYRRMLAHYKNGKKEYVLYGDYSNYANKPIGKLIEFMHFTAKNDDFKPLIQAEKAKLVQDGNIDIIAGSPLHDILLGLKYNMEDITGEFDQKNVNALYNISSDMANFKFELKEETKALYLKALEDEKLGITEDDDVSYKSIYGKILAENNASLQAALLKKKQLKKTLQIIDAAFSYQAIMNVLSKYNLPISVEAMAKEPEYLDMVSPIYQNDNLRATMNILGNEAVFKYLYINQRSSLEQFNNILDKFGLGVKDVSKKRANIYTPTAIVETKGETSGGRDGIGIAAIMNKFLAIANQYSFSLKPEKVVWKFKDEKNNLVEKKDFGKINDLNQRIIGVMGNILGGFADIVKDPVLLALQLNEINTSTTLAMIGTGLDPEFAFAFNFLPEVRNAVQTVRSSQFAISDDLDDSYKFYNDAIADQIKAIINKEELTETGVKILPGAKLIQNLKRLNIVDASTFDKKADFEWTGKLKLNKENIKIEFGPQDISDSYTSGKYSNNILTPSDIGFKVFSAETNEQLSDDEAKLVLLTMYQEQSELTWDLSKTASITNLFKRLNPSLDAFDKLMKNIADFSSGKVFTEDSVKRFFSDTEVWSVFQEMLDDASVQFSKIFIERTPFFAPFANVLKDYFMNKETIAKTISSYLALHRFKNTYPKTRPKSDDEYIQKQIDKDTETMLKVFTPEYWFTDSSALYSRVEKMLKKYPNNEFLKLLTVQETDSLKGVATVVYNGEVYEGIGQTYIKMLNKAKVKGEYAGKVADSINFLYNNGDIEEKQLVRELFYHDIVRTGYSNAKASFLSLMPVEFKIPLSNNITDFITGLQEISKSYGTLNFEEKFMDFMKEYTGLESQEDVYKFFNELYLQLAYAAKSEANNRKIRVFSDGNKNKSSIRFNLTDNFNMTSKLIKEFLDDKKKDLSTVAPQEMVKAKIDAFKYITKDVLKLSEYAKYTNDMILQTQEISLTGITDTITIDLSNGTKKYAKVNDAIARMFKANKDDVSSKPGNVNYNFPAIIRFNGKTYVLQGVDMLTPQEIGKTMIEAITMNKVFTSVGKTASYTVIPEDYSNELSPIAFTSEDAKKLNDYITGKANIIKNTKVVNTNKNQTFNPDTIASEADAVIITNSSENVQKLISEADVDDEYSVYTGNEDADDEFVNQILSFNSKKSSEKVEKDPEESFKLMAQKNPLLNQLREKLGLTPVVVKPEGMPGINLEDQNNCGGA